MEKKLNKIFKTKFYRFVIVPLLLFVLWLFLTCIYIITYDKSLTVISYFHDKENISKVNDKILKGEIVSGEFQARENNLGIVSVKFKLFDRPRFKDEDTLLFRIKEKGARDWYHQNSYMDGLMYEVPIFPFGFPLISDSRDKTYYFEIESLRGNENNSVAVSNKGQIIFSKYYVPKDVLLSSSDEFASYITRKFVSSLLTTDLRFSSFIYLLPLIFYLILISPFGKQIVNPAFRKIYKPFIPFVKVLEKYVVPYLSLILLFVILTDIFFVQVVNDMVYVVVGALWVILLRINKIKSYYSYVLILFLISLTPLFIFIKEPQIAEKCIVWGYMILIFAVLQSIIEYKRSKLSNKSTA